MNTRQLLERRGKIVKELRELQDAADAAADGAMSAEQQAAFDKLKAALAELEDAMGRRALIEEAERRMAGQAIGGTGDARLDREMSQFSVTRAIGAAAGIAGIDAGREREVSTELARRSGRQTEGIIVPFGALAETRVVTSAGPVPPGTGVSPPGYNNIQTTLDGSRWIDALRNRTVILDHGATLITELTTFLDIPRLVTPAQTAFVAENTSFPVSDETWEKLQLRPRSAGGIVEVSRTMLLASAAPGIEDLVRRDLTAGIARTLDAAALTGAGGTQPLGILNTPGIGVVSMGVNGGPLTFAIISDLIGAVQDANADADGESFLFLASPKVRRAAAKLTDTQARPLGLDVVFQGIDRYFSNQLPSNGTKGTGTGLSTLLYGDLSSVFVGMWGAGVEVLVNPYAQDAYARGNVQVRVICTCDVGLRHAAQWSAITDIAA